MKQNKTINVYMDDGCELPESAQEFVDFWQNKINSIQGEFRRSSIIKFRGVDNHGSPRVEISFGYTRPETDAEEQERERFKENQTRIREKNDREQYERLKIKFGE